MNYVANPFVEHGPNGHYGQPVRNHVEGERDHVIELLPGMMIQNSLMLKRTAATPNFVQTGEHGSHGAHVRNHVTKRIRLNPSKIDIDAGILTSLKIVALVSDMYILIMMKELAIQTINALLFVNGVIGVNGMHAIRIARKDCEFEGVLIMKSRRMQVALV